jgi:hypothetical protein
MNECGSDPGTRDGKATRSGEWEPRKEVKSARYFGGLVRGGVSSKKLPAHGGKFGIPHGTEMQRAWVCDGGQNSIHIGLPS